MVVPRDQAALDIEALGLCTLLSFCFLSSFNFFLSRAVILGVLSGPHQRPPEAGNAGLEVMPATEA